MLTLARLRAASSGPGPAIAAIRQPSRDRVRRDTLKVRRRFAAARAAEAQYGVQLRSIGRHVGDLVKGFDIDDDRAITQLEAVLESYADTLRPWAHAAANRMLMDVSRRDYAVWAQLGKEMRRSLHREIMTAPTGEALAQLMDEQVALITSLPIEAAQRVHELVLQRLETSGRGSQIAAEILRSGEVSESRARTIARTEVARSSSVLVQVRAIHVGSEGYIWRDVGDSAVRRLHRKLNGRFIRWDSPPVAGSNGERAHAGCIYNCRCAPEPVIPEEP